MDSYELNRLRRFVRKCFLTSREEVEKTQLFGRVGTELIRLNKGIDALWTREVLGVRGVGARPNDREWSSLQDLRESQKKIQEAIKSGCVSHDPENEARLIEFNIVKSAIEVGEE